MKLAQRFEAAAAADAAGTESDDVEQRDARHTSSARGVGNGRGRGRGRVKQKAVRLQPHEVRRLAPSLVATGAMAQLEVLLEDPVNQPAKKLKHVSKEGKVVSIATGPSSCVLAFAVDLAGRILHAEVTLNGKFHKQYSNEHPVPDPLFPGFTLRQAYHLVSNIDLSNVILCHIGNIE